jgi:hypothetical protein
MEAGGIRTLLSRAGEVIEWGKPCAVRKSGYGRFFCKSRLRQVSKRDSVVLTRISARSIHDGPYEE